MTPLEALRALVEAIDKAETWNEQGDGPALAAAREVLARPEPAYVPTCQVDGGCDLPAVLCEAHGGHDACAVAEMKLKRQLREPPAYVPTEEDAALVELLCKEALYGAEPRIHRACYGHALAARLRGKA